MTLNRFFVENGLSLVMFGLFLTCMFLQTWSGIRVYNQERSEQGQGPVGLGLYLGSGHFLEATAENWESEFLQMAAFVWLTSFLFQKGSPQSNDPYKPDENAPVTEQSPWPVRRGGWLLTWYSHSLPLALMILFVVSFFLHALGGAWEHNAVTLQTGEPILTWWQFLGTSEFWFQSMQNWQSEFLSIGAMVVLSIFLRQKGSAESKPLAMPHHQNQ